MVKNTNTNAMATPTDLAKKKSTVDGVLPTKDDDTSVVAGVDEEADAEGDASEVGSRGTIMCEASAEGKCCKVDMAAIKDSRAPPLMWTTDMDRPTEMVVFRLTEDHGQVQGALMRFENME